jgi:hypothetical protein
MSDVVMNAIAAEVGGLLSARFAKAAGQGD